MVLGNSEGVGGGGSQTSKYLKESIQLNWNIQTKKNIRGAGNGYFLEQHNGAQTLPRS